MLSRRLTARTPSAEPTGIVHVDGRRLIFDKVSRDGSGKCHADATGKNTDRVYGVLFEIRKNEKDALDRAEGLGEGYKEEYVDMVTGSGIRRVVTYVATHKERIVRPYHWYKALVIAGAVEHGLPNHYLEWLRAFESVEDSDAEG